MLRILLGYRGQSTREDPVVLYAGHDGDAAQAAADAAPKELVRLRRIDGAQERNARRSPAAVAAEEAVAAVAEKKDVPASPEGSTAAADDAAAVSPTRGSRKPKTGQPDLSGEE